MHVPNVSVSYQYTLRQTVQYGHSCCQWLRSDSVEMSTLPNPSLDLQKTASDFLPLNGMTVSFLV